MKIENVKYMLMAQDMERAVAFYRDVIGLTPTMVSPFWSELTFRDAIVALHGGGGGRGQVRRRPILREPEDRPGESIRLGEFADTGGNAFDLTEFKAYNG